MTLYLIRVTGSDDETLVEVDLADTEAETVTRIAQAITDASGRPCQPYMRARPAITATDLDALPTGSDAEVADRWWTKTDDGQWRTWWTYGDRKDERLTSARLIATEGPILSTESRED